MRTETRAGRPDFDATGSSQYATGMTTPHSVEALIRECSMYEEHLNAQLADADTPERMLSLIDVIARLRRLKAELVGAHPKRLTSRAARADRRTR